MERGKDDLLRHTFRHFRPGLYGTPPRRDFDHVIVPDPQTFRILGMDLDERGRRLPAEQADPPGHGAGVVMEIDAPGGQREVILLIGRFGDRPEVAGEKRPSALGKPVPVQIGRARVLLVGTGPLQAV